MPTDKKVVIPPVNPDATPSGKSSFAQALASLGAGGAPIPTTTTTNYLTQTSQPDIASIVNQAMQQLTGRYATADEIKSLGSQLLAAQKQYAGQYTGETTYQESGKRAAVTGTQLSQGVDAQAFIQSLIQGTADAKEYKAATGYFDEIMKANSQFKGAYSG